MPKKTKKSAKQGTAKGVIGRDEEDIVSVSSDLTDSTNQNSDDENIANCEDEMIKFESKMRDALDLAIEKSAATRVNALLGLISALEKKLLESFLLDNYQTLTDRIERSLKKGRPSEQVAAAKLLSVLMVQLLGTEDAEKIYETIYPLLDSLVKDSAVQANVRVEVAHAYAISAYIGCPQTADSDFSRSLNSLHKIFCAALPKGNGELPTNSVAVNAIHAAALEGVCLLMTLLPTTELYSKAPTFLEELYPVLKCTDLALRIRVGEAIALVYECARVHLKDFRWKKQPMLLELLEEFVNESHKYKGKKDRATQRTSFRDIYQSILHKELAVKSISVGPMYGSEKERQKIYLETWALRSQYESLHYALDKGLDYHMTYNEPLRELFDLGPPLNPIDVKSSIIRRGKRFNRQSPKTKRKVLLRNKNRDNRAAALEFID